MEYNENTDILFLSDDKVFYTVEGEGCLMGKPSVFMRLAMCNLTCIGFKSPDSPFGCDSYTSWKVKNKYTFKDIYTEFFEKTGYLEKIKGEAILKITGGEPLIQQNQLIKFISYLIDKSEDNWFINIDFETNGTIIPHDYWKENYMASFTVSPKLASNGDPKEKRYVPEALQWHAENRSCFKFVVQNEGDIEEVNKEYVEKFRIRKERVWLMPCCGSRDELIEKSAQVVEWCKEHNYNYSPRLQLLVWNKALKV